MLDQYRAAEPGLPTPARRRRCPGGKLTAEQRAQVKRTFGSPRFEAAVADDDTIRQLVVTTRFTTPPANQEAAGGITGGRMEYRVDYTDVGKAITITPAEDAADFRLRPQMQRILPSAARSAGQ